MPVRNLIVELYKELEAIGHRHPELYDMDVRETLSETLLYYFVWEHPLEPEPCSYSMYSASADRKVSRSVTKFLRAATPAAAAEGMRGRRVIKHCRIPASSRRAAVDMTTLLDTPIRPPGSIACSPIDSRSRSIDS